MKSAVFRADASVTIGSGHVMRCLTLASALRDEGVDVYFVCRDHEGNLCDLISGRGFKVFTLPVSKEKYLTLAEDPPHADWLGCHWQVDAEQTEDVLREIRPDFLVVDHYALDKRWENSLRLYCRNIMVIDDLHDREHDCDILLDVTLDCTAESYKGLVPQQCEILTGCAFVLMRPEFSALRDESLLRREEAAGLSRILISMGGMDPDNITAKALDAMPWDILPENCETVIVMGGKAPWLEEVRRKAANLDRPVEVRVDVPDMATLMKNSDAAIGASGGTSWERCCLGLPTLTGIIAENQNHIVERLSQNKAALSAGDFRKIGVEDLRLKMKGFLQDAGLRHSLSRSSAVLCDGMGTQRVLERMMRYA